MGYLDKQDRGNRKTLKRAYNKRERNDLTFRINAEVHGIINPKEGGRRGIYDRYRFSLTRKSSLPQESHRSQTTRQLNKQQSKLFDVLCVV